jgi:predicted nucleotidyltransferase component of viral defense system
MRDQYLAQTRLLLDVLPIVSKYTDFALKGGTALNYFLHDMPRLSVDIDLQYLPVTEYQEAQQEIHSQLERLCRDINRAFPSSHCQYLRKKFRITVRNRNADIKIETNDVIRGQVFDPVRLELCEKVSREFGASFDFNCLNKADLYAGKLSAALDRQHPRDLFDIRYLLNQAGTFDREIVQAFVVYLVASKRSIRELLDPRPQDIADTFVRKFSGMTDSDIGLDALVEIQAQLPGILMSLLSGDDKQFLLSFKRGDPDWSLLPIPHARDLPAVKWKQLNLDRMDVEDRKEAIEKLESLLN